MEGVVELRGEVEDFGLLSPRVLGDVDDSGWTEVVASSMGMSRIEAFTLPMACLAATRKRGFLLSTMDK